MADNIFKLGFTAEEINSKLAKIPAAWRDITDQEYNAYSDMPQSGKAVSKAILDKAAELDLSITAKAVDEAVNTVRDTIMPGAADQAAAQVLDKIEQDVKFQIVTEAKEAAVTEVTNTLPSEIQDRTITTAKDLFANSLKGTVSGNNVTLTTMSPLDHTLKVKIAEITGYNLLNPNEALTNIVNSSYLGIRLSKELGHYTLSFSLKEGATAPTGINFGIVYNGKHIASAAAIWMLNSAGTILKNSATTSSISSKPNMENINDIGIAVHPATQDAWNSIFNAFNVQLEFGTTASEYKPYEPINIVTHESKNLLPFNINTDYCAGKSKTVSGVKFTVNSDGSIKVKGTASSNAAFRLQDPTSRNDGNQTFFLSGCPTQPDNSGTNKWYLVLKSGSEEYYDFGQGKLVENIKLSQAQIGFVVMQGVTIDTTIYPMLELDNKASTFETPNIAIQAISTNGIGFVQSAPQLFAEDKNILLEVEYNKDLSTEVSSMQNTLNEFSFEDLKNKPFYSQVETVLDKWILAEQELTFEITYEQEGISQLSEPLVLEKPLVAGTPVVLYIDGIRYQCTLDIIESRLPQLIGAGNMSLFTGEYDGTGEEFFILFNIVDREYSLWVASKEATHTVEIVHLNDSLEIISEHLGSFVSDDPFGTGELRLGEIFIVPLQGSYEEFLAMNFNITFNNQSYSKVRFKNAADINKDFTGYFYAGNIGVLGLPSLTALDTGEEFLIFYVPDEGALAFTTRLPEGSYLYSLEMPFDTIEREVTHKLDTAFLDYKKDAYGNVIFETDVFIKKSTSLKNSLLEHSSQISDINRYRLVEGLVIDNTYENIADLTAGLSANRLAVPTNYGAWIEGGAGESILNPDDMNNVTTVTYSSSNKNLTFNFEYSYAASNFYNKLLDYRKSAITHLIVTLFDDSTKKTYSAYTSTNVNQVDSSIIMTVEPHPTLKSSLYEGYNGVGEFALNGVYLVNGVYSHAEGYGTIASGSRSHAEGYDTLANGDSSHAEGEYTTASGNYSHAEGVHTTASSTGSHAEGSSTTASGVYSHAEGTSTTASGIYSHAEGCGATASGAGSHAEGSSTTASGYYSHAEGSSTTASGSYSHAEGYGTIASGDYSHVQGRYNIEDTTNIYAHIIGNGQGTFRRSNAHTVDWKGNAWYAGTIEAINGIILKSSTEGSSKRFKITVDDTGTLSVSEYVEEVATINIEAPIE